MNEEPSPGELALWQVLALIPAGQVVTYGQLAELAGLPRQARRVGRLLAQLPEDTSLPWHRVINAQGRLSLASQSTAAALQTERLRSEGVDVQQGRVSLVRYRWVP